MTDSELISLNFSSQFRNNGSLSDPEFVFYEDINNINSLKLRNFCAPLTISLFDSRNNRIYYRETTSGTLISATITSGNYVMSGNASNSILTQLKSVLETNSPNTWTYNVSYSDITNKITVSTTNGNFALFDGINNAYYELGFDTNNLGNYSSSITGNEPIDLSGLKILHIVSNIATTRVFNKQFNILASIILEEENLSISSYDDQSSDYVKSNLKSLSSLRLSFYDERFRKLTINKDYSLSINFYVD